jgi:putative nucleotidyltransferase with HDIG domain
MSEAARFLSGFGRAMSAALLYAPGHPTLERAIDGAWQDLTDLVAAGRAASFTLLGDTVLFGDRPLLGRRSWEWAGRLSAAGLQRLEFSSDVEREAFEGFLADVVDRLSGRLSSSAAERQFAQRGIRIGAIGLQAGGAATEPAAPAGTPAYSLREEAEAIRWVHDEVNSTRMLPLVEAEAIIRSLSVAMHADQRLMLPLLRLKDFDQYTTTHSLNVAVLAMGLAEYLGLSSSEVRGFGIAGLLHDLGKVRIPIEILTKPGRLTDAERAVMNQHPADGARLILRSEEQLDVAAAVAYEHHIMIDGGGYPRLRCRRECHPASVLVHVCDVYDALRTNRPYRDAWPQDRTIAYLREGAGREFDPEVTRAFIQMMDQWAPRVAVLGDEDEAVPAGNGGTPPTGA